MSSMTSPLALSGGYARGYAAIDVTRFVNRHAVGLLDLVETLPRSEHALEAFHALLGECNEMFPDPAKQAGPLGHIVQFLMGMGAADVDAAIANGALPKDVDAALRWYLGRLCDLRAQFADAGISVPT